MGKKKYQPLTREWSPEDEAPDTPFAHVVRPWHGPLPTTAHGQRTWTDLCRLLLALGIGQATGKTLKWVPGHDVQPRGRGRPVRRERRARQSGKSARGEPVALAGGGSGPSGLA